MEISASGPEAIPIILLAVGVPIIIFLVIPILIIRSIVKSIKGRLPSATTLKELHQIAQQFPAGIDWETLKHDWDLKMDRESGKVTVTRKTAVGKEGDSTLRPSEIQVTELTQLPDVFRKIIKETKSAAPSSSGLPISTPKTPPPQPMDSPRTYELIQNIKRIAIVILILGIFYGLRDFFI